MRLKGLWAVALMAAVPWMLQAQDDDAAKADSPADQYKAIAAEYQAEYQAFLQKYQAAGTAEERNEIIQQMPDRAAYADRFLDLALDNADDPAAVDALIWVVQNAAGSPPAAEATKQLAKAHYKSDKIGPALQMMTRSPSPATEEFIRKVMDENPDANTQALATYALAGYLKQVKSYADMLSSSERGALIRNSFGDEVADYIEEQGGNPMLDGEIEAAYEKIASDYKDVAYGNSTLGQMVEAELFELRFLSVGKEAPEIEGEDVEGEVFKLSDYRGKVVMLDFWGDW